MVSSRRATRLISSMIRSRWVSRVTAALRILCLAPRHRIPMIGTARSQNPIQNVVSLCSRVPPVVSGDHEEHPADRVDAEIGDRRRRGFGSFLPVLVVNPGAQVTEHGLALRRDHPIRLNQTRVATIWATPSTTRAATGPPSGSSSRSPGSGFLTTGTW